VTLSTFAHDSFQRGLTITGDIQLQPSGSLAQTVGAITPSTQSYDLNLYIPVYTNVSNFNFTLTNSGSIAITQTVAVNGFTFDFSLQQVSFKTSVQVTGIPTGVTYNSHPKACLSKTIP
jgi:hypothetical protein